MSFAVTAIAIQGTGAIMGAFGARNAAIGQRNALRFQANMAEINAQSAERSAQQTLLASQQSQGRLSMKAERTKSSQRVAMAANGIDMAGSDLATNMLASTEFMAQSDALTIDANSTMQAEAYRAQKVNSENDAMIKRATASGINPDMAFATSLISSASSVATSWYSMNNSGAMDRGLSNWRSL
jgi:hypothetical protein